MDKLIERLGEIASKKCWSDFDDWAPVTTHCGIGAPEAWDGGYTEGEVQLARKLLKEFFPSPIESINDTFKALTEKGK